MKLRDLFFLFIALVLLCLCFASCGELSNDQEGAPTVVLTQRTDTSSVWLVYGTERPDTCFVDIFPSIEYAGQHYIGRGYGYVLVYKAVYRHGNEPQQ